MRSLGAKDRASDGRPDGTLEIPVTSEGVSVGMTESIAVLALLVGTFSI
jgi:hypothetical protein